MTYGISFVVLLFALSIGTAPLNAQGRGKGQANRPAAGSTRGGVTADHTKPSHVKPATGKKTTTTSTTTTSTAQTEARVKGKPHTGPRKTDMAAASTTVTPTTTITPTTPTTIFAKNPKLEARLLKLLPLDTNLQDASTGFKNWGQFVAAVHVSNNLGLSFNDLKTLMTGIPLPTGAPPVPGTPPTTTVGAQMSLGQAIQTLTGGTATETGTLTQTKIKNEVKKAEDAANQDLSSTRVSS